MSNLFYAIAFVIGLVALMGIVQQDDEQHRQVEQKAASRYNYAQHVDRDAFGQLVQQGNSLGYVAYSEVRK